ncbi:MAG: hypothetical protein ACK2T0_04310, partial [Anaerolineales bacterium]
AKVEVQYRTWEEMESFAAEHYSAHQGRAAEIRMLAMYCVGFRREVYEDIGPLDEEFGAGMFEDDDYSYRVRQKGLQIICAQDVFVHHFGQAAFARLIEDDTYDSLFHENRRRFETKWDTTWLPHRTGELKAKQYLPAGIRSEAAGMHQKAHSEPAADAGWSTYLENETSPDGTARRRSLAAEVAVRDQRLQALSDKLAASESRNRAAGDLLQQREESFERQLEQQATALGRELQERDEQLQAVREQLSRQEAAGIALGESLAAERQARETVRREAAENASLVRSQKDDLKNLQTQLTNVESELRTLR